MPRGWGDTGAIQQRRRRSRVAWNSFDGSYSESWGWEPKAQSSAGGLVALVGAGLMGIGKRSEESYVFNTSWRSVNLKISSFQKRSTFFDCFEPSLRMNSGAGSSWCVSTWLQRSRKWWASGSLRSAWRRAETLQRHKAAIIIDVTCCFQQPARFQQSF